MLHSARPAWFTHSLAALVVVLAAGCGHTPETISPTEEAEVSPAAKPLGAAEPEPSPAACDPGDKEACHCDPDKSAEALGDTRERVELGQSPTRGKADAPVTIVVFSDFECPFCTRAQDTLHTLEEEYSGKLRVVFKHMPLKFHPHAEEAARAAVAAEAQGKFWELSEALFHCKKQLDSQRMEEMATSMGMDVARFRRDMRASETSARLAADQAEVERLGVQGAPTFFVNGRRVKGAQPIEVFRKVIDQALADDQAK